MQQFESVSIDINIFTLLIGKHGINFKCFDDSLEHTMTQFIERLHGVVHLPDVYTLLSLSTNFDSKFQISHYLMSLIKRLLLQRIEIDS